MCFVRRRNAAACQQVATWVNRPAVLELFTSCAIIGSVKLSSIESLLIRIKHQNYLCTTWLRLKPLSSSRLCNRNVTTEACNVENRLRTTFWIAINCTRVSAESRQLTMMIVVKQSLWKALADTSIFHHYGDIDFWLEWDTSRGIEKHFTATLIAVYENVFMALQFSPHFSSSRAGWLETSGGDKRLSVCVVWQDKDCVIWKTLHSRLPYKAATKKRYSNISLFYSRVDHKIFVLFTIFSPPT